MSRQTFVRAFEADLLLSDDESHVAGRVVPIGEVARIRELDPLTGEIDEYDEVFLPGCTARLRQRAARNARGPSWINLTIDHERTFDHRIGFCRSIVETAAGVDCEFRLHDDDPGRLAKVRSMLRESHSGLSIEFSDHVAPIVDGSLRMRRQINISAVSATAIPAYESARVLAVRSDLDDGGVLSTPNLDAVRAILADR